MFTNPRTVKVSAEEAVKLYVILQVKDLVKYCTNGDVKFGAGGEDFNKVERLRRPRNNLTKKFSKSSKQLSNRERLLRFRHTN